MTDTQLALFNYEDLDTETRIVVQQRTSEIKALMRTTAQGIIDIGEKLIDVRSKLDTGKFRGWLRLEFEWSHMTAYRFIQVSERFSSNNLLQGDIAPSALYLLASPSTPDDIRDHFIEQAQSGEKVTYSEVRSLKKAFELAPDPIKERLINGEIAPKTAEQLVKALEQTPAPVREVVLEHRVSDPEIVPEITRLYEQKRETFEVMATTGTIDGELPLEKATVRDVANYLDAAEYEHKQQAIEEKRHKKAVEIARIAERSAALDPVQLGVFPVIYADPPWQYEHIETLNRAIENHYPTMELGKICAMPVHKLAAKDCVLFLWATSPKLFEAMTVLHCWGFSYRTCMVWDKEKIGMGYYFRQQHELLLVATRGVLPVPLPENRPSSVLRSPRSKHSEKPEEVYELIEAMYPEYRKIELFSRNARQGWLGWGNQYDDHSARFSDAA